MKTYFITGGLGFIGYHLSKRLLDEGNKVIIFDAQKHYVPLDRSLWTYYLEYRISNLKYENLKIRRGDCTDSGWLSENLKKYKPDRIVHLAALSIAGISNNYSTEARTNIFDSTATLLETIRQLPFGIERLLYVSSSMVYGNFLRDKENNVISANEEQSCNPIDLYGAMKLSSEHLVKVYNYRFNIPYVIARPSAVYGHTDCNYRVTEIFLRNALSKLPLYLDNGGHHQIDFSYIDDIIDGLHLCLNSNNALGQTFNITKGEGRQIKDLAEIVAALVPGTKIEFCDNKPYRPNRGGLDISKAKQLLGYMPKVSLEEGMKMYLDLIRNDKLI